MRISNLTDFTLELAGSNAVGRRQLFVTGTYSNSAKMMSAIFDIANSTVQSLGVPNIAYSLSFQPMPTAITSKAASRGGNSLGLSASDGNLFNLLLTASWDLACTTSTCTSTMLHRGKIRLVATAQQTRRSCRLSARSTIRKGCSRTKFLVGSNSSTSQRK
jgi:hypothetical protein